MIGNIWIIHISPETNSAGEILPHALIFPDTFLALLDKWLQTVFFDLVFSVKT